ncbi:MAG: hypothetical protein JJU00_19245 [Opitutales bacterium]|nr:hypothetical protein [Opitutales bacterium]
MDRIDVLNAAAGYSNELTTRQARLLDARGRFALNGRDYSQRFYGNQHAVTSSARVAAAKATQARLARVGMTLAKMTPIVSVGLGSYNLLAGGASNRAIVEMASSFAFTGVGVLGPKGAAISLGLTITNASGGFDGFYSRFDHTPRFNLRLFGRDPEGESP